MPDLPSSEARTKPARKYPERVRRDSSKLNATERKVLSLQLIGLKQKQIAERLGRHEKHISRICHYARYQKAREERLAEIEEAQFIRDLIAMKPQVIRAFEDALQSEDADVALNAAVQLCKLRPDIFFGRGTTAPPLNAQDLAMALLEKTAARRATQIPVEDVAGTLSQSVELRDEMLPRRPQPTNLMPIRRRIAEPPRSEERAARERLYG